MLKEYVREQIKEILKEEDYIKSLQLIIKNEKLISDLSSILNNNNLNEGLLDLLSGPYSKKEIVLLLGILGVVYSSNIFKDKKVTEKGFTEPANKVTRRLVQDEKTKKAITPLSKKAYEYIMQGNHEDVKEELLNPLATVFEKTFEASRDSNEISTEETEERSKDNILNDIKNINLDSSDLKLGSYNGKKFNEELEKIKKLSIEIKKLIGNEAITKEMYKSILELRDTLNWLNIHQDKDTYPDGNYDDVYSLDEELLKMQKQYMTQPEENNNSEQKDTYEEEVSEEDLGLENLDLDDLVNKINDEDYDNFDIEELLDGFKQGNMSEKDEEELKILIQDIIKSNSY